MKIRIVKEKTITPNTILHPTKNIHFKGLQLAPSTQQLEQKDTARLQLFMHQKAYEAMWTHAKTSSENELGGVLLGIYAQYEGQEFLVVTDVFNQPASYFQAPTLIKFTNQFFNHLEDYMEQVNLSHPQIIRLGLYHTHPNYGVYLSKTDAKTFKGVFKGKHQIALVVDPVRQQDGFFYWSREGNNDETNISQASSYTLFQSDNPLFSPHLMNVKDTIIAACNSQLEYVPTATDTAKVGEEQRIKPANVSINKEQSNKKERIKITLKDQKLAKSETPIVVKKEKTMQLIPLAYLPKMSPLYDFRYKNTSIKLLKYIRSLRVKRYYDYPNMIFIQEAIRLQVEAAICTTDTLIGVLYGDYCIDRLKNEGFLMIEAVKLKAVDNIDAKDAIATYIQQEQKTINSLPIVGWLYVSSIPFDDTIYPYYDMHQQLFNRNHCLGVVCYAQKAFLLQNARLVAYNFDKNIAYDFFKHLFWTQKQT